MTNNKKILGIILALGALSGFACGDSGDSSDVDVGKIDGGSKPDSGIKVQDAGTSDVDGDTPDDEVDGGSESDAGGNTSDDGGTGGGEKKTMNDFLNAPTTGVENPEKDIGDLEGLLDSNGDIT